MRPERMTFAPAWADERNHQYLEKHAKKNFYRLKGEDKQEWKLRSIESAVNTFDPDRGTKFSTHLINCGERHYKKIRRKQRRQCDRTLPPVKPAHIFRKAYRDWKRGEVVAGVQEVLASMDETDAAILLERYGHGRKVPELMLDYGMTKRQVEYRVKQAAKRFAKLWGQRQ